MASIRLLNQRVREMHLRNEIRKAGQLQLGSNFNFSMKYAPDGKQCAAVLYQSFEEKGEEKGFSCSITLEGIFACEGIRTPEDKRHAHLQAYDSLFPYLQAAVSQIFASTGLPGFMVKKMQLEESKVVLSQGKQPGEGNVTQLPIV